MIRWNEVLKQITFPKKVKTVEAKLRYLYVDKELSTGEIGELLAVSHMSVLNHLAKYDIQRRGKGGSNNLTGRTGKTASPESVDSVARCSKSHRRT